MTTTDDTTNPPLKRCTKCGREYPLLLEFWKPAKNTKIGFTSPCRACSQEWARRYSDIHSEEVRARSKKWYSENKERQKENRKRRRSDPVLSQSRKEKEKLKRETLESKAYQSQYRKTPQQKERERERGRKRWEDPQYREKKRIHGHNYRAAKRGLPNGFTYDQWVRCLEYWGYKCAVCGSPSGFWHTLAPDHWVAVKNNGATIADNIIPLCHSKKDGYNCCNNSKQDTEAEIWLISRYGQRKANQILKKIKSYFEWVKQQD